MSKEYRFSQDSEFRILEEDGKKYLKGYGIVFNSDSRMLYGWFIERIAPEALDNTDMTEIISKYNHDINHTLGTTWGNTLEWGKDQRGVWYKVEIPETTTGKDVEVLVQRGDLRGSSFEFQIGVDGSKWSEREVADGIKVDIREVSNISIVSDLSPVMRPAYPATEGALEVYKREQRSFMGTTEDKGPEKPTSTNWLNVFK